MEVYKLEVLPIYGIFIELYYVVRKTPQVGVTSLRLSAGTIFVHTNTQLKILHEIPL
jgi:hypothetical protein